MTDLAFEGNLAADPELRYTPSGAPVVEFVVLENQPRKGENGEWEDGEPNRFRVKAWRSLAENIAESTTSGSPVIVIGRLVTERFQDRETSQTRTSQHVVAKHVGFGLKWHSVTATRTAKTSSTEENAG